MDGLWKAVCALLRLWSPCSRLKQCSAAQVELLERRVQLVVFPALLHLNHRNLGWLQLEGTLKAI